MFVGVCRIIVHLRGNESLKGKRSVVRRVVERTRAKFNAAVAEVADNDSHQRAVIGAAVVGNSTSHVDSMLANVASFMESISEAPVASVETEIIPMGDELWKDEAPW